MSNDYEVGYGKPPKHTQFKRGQSGNPAGRPRKVRNFKTDLQEELQAHVTVSEGGNPQVVTRQRALIKRTMEQALKGDLKAIQLLVQWAGIYLLGEPESLAAEPLAAEDLALLARHGLAREIQPGADNAANVEGIDDTDEGEVDD